MTQVDIEKNEAQQIVDKVVPDLQRALEGAWDNLLWEPHIKEEAADIIGYPFESSRALNQIGRGSYGDKYVRFVDPQGRLMEAVLSKDIVTGRVVVKKSYGLVVYDNRLLAYTSFAPKAFEVLTDLYQDQLDLLKESPDGMDIIWRPGQTRFRHYFSDEQPTSLDDQHTLAPVKVRAKWDRENEIMRLYCPEHTRLELVHSMVVRFPQDNWIFCPVSGKCIRVCSNPAHWRKQINC